VAANEQGLLLVWLFEKQQLQPMLYCKIIILLLNCLYVAHIAESPCCTPLYFNIEFITAILSIFENTPTGNCIIAIVGAPNNQFL
jgi:hypothetical protein